MALRGAGLQLLGQSIAQAGQQFAQIPLLRDQANRQRIKDEQDAQKFALDQKTGQMNLDYVSSQKQATDLLNTQRETEAAQNTQNALDEETLNKLQAGDSEAGARFVSYVVEQMKQQGYTITPPQMPQSAQQLMAGQDAGAQPKAPQFQAPAMRPAATTPMVGMGSAGTLNPMQARGAQMQARGAQMQQEALDEMGSLQYPGLASRPADERYEGLRTNLSGSRSPVVGDAIKMAQQDANNEANRQSAEERALAAAQAKRAAAALGEGRNDAVRFEKWRAEIAGSPQFKTLKNTSMAADDALRLLSEGNPAVDGTVVVKIARMMGESGVLSDQDMKRIGGDVSFFQRLADKMSKGTEGTMSAHNRQLFSDLAQLIKDKSELKLDELMELHRAEGYARADRTLVDNALNTLRYTSAFAEGASATTPPPGKAGKPATPGAQTKPAGPLKVGRFTVEVVD